MPLPPDPEAPCGCDSCRRSGMPETVLYEPDKASGFTQALLPSRPRLARVAMAHFLGSCEEVRGPARVALRAYHPTQWDDPVPIERCAERVLARFGPPAHTASGGNLWPSGEPVMGGHLEWLGNERYEEFCDFVVAGDPWPKATLGPVSVEATFSFLWRDPDSMSPLPALLQGFGSADGTLRSAITVTFQRRSTVAPSLAFPYRHDDPRLRDLIQLLTPQIPFRLSPRHFRAVVPTRNGTDSTFRRFDAAALLAP